MLSLDIYVNETSRHADVILPSPARWRSRTTTWRSTSSPRATWPTTRPPCSRRNGMPQEWETLARLAGIVSGQGPDADVDAVDAMVIATLVGSELGDPHSRIAGRDQGEILAELEPRRGPERILDLMLRAGPYGDAVRRRPGGTDAQRLEESPHGVDLGPATAAHPRGAAHSVGQGRAGAGASWWPTSRACGSRSARANGRWSCRPPPAALEQLVDAQPRPTREGQGPLYRPRAPRGRAAPGPDRRRARAAALGRRARSRRPWRSRTR